MHASHCELVFPLWHKSLPDTDLGACTCCWLPCSERHVRVALCLLLGCFSILPLLWRKRIQNGTMNHRASLRKASATRRWLVTYRFTLYLVTHTCHATWLVVNIHWTIIFNFVFMDKIRGCYQDCITPNCLEIPPLHVSIYYRKTQANGENWKKLGGSEYEHRYPVCIIPSTNSGILSAK